MWDEKDRGKNQQDDYIRFKKTIQEIVGLSKNKKKGKSKRNKEKDEETMDMSESLMKQFIKIQKFQKGLAAAALSDNKDHSKKSKGSTNSSSGASASDKDLRSTYSNPRIAVNKKSPKKQEYHTDELDDTSSDEDSDFAKGSSTTEGTVTDESGSEETSSNYDNDQNVSSRLDNKPKADSKLHKEPKVSSKLDNESEAGSNFDNESKASSQLDNEYMINSKPTRSGKTRKEILPVQPVKKKSILSPSELAIIKDLCRDLIKKDEKPEEETEKELGSPIKERETLECSQNVDEVCSILEEEEPTKIEQKMTQNRIADNRMVDNEQNKKQQQNKAIHKYEIEENENKQKHELKPEKSSIPYSSNMGSPIAEDKLTIEPQNNESEAEQTKIMETVEYCQEPNDEVNSSLLLKGNLIYITEHEEDTITTADEKFQKVHLEIMTKETVDEAEEKKRIEEKVVIKKTVKVKLEEAEVTDNETKKMEAGNQEITLSNMSDDDLIRRTIREMDQIDQEFIGEKASQEMENDNYYYSGIGDGDKVEEKRSLEERIELLQEQILSLKKQLEEAKRQNEEEAKEISYLSAFLVDRESSLLRNGLEWEEWELKEMVRERLQQKREAAAQEYQARLKVVEALCSAEMGKLEEALQTLVPLNATVSTWDPPPLEVPDVRSSWQTQDYFFEVVTSMNLSSTDENGISSTISTNGEQPSLKEWKAEGQ